MILWQFWHALPESREQQAMQLIALSFFALAGYLAQYSVRALVSGADPDASPVGITLAATSLLVMPRLSWAQRRTAQGAALERRRRGEQPTLLCTYLSAVLLDGLVLNAMLGWGWGWADSTAGLVIASVALKDGRDAWRGRGLLRPRRPHDGHGTESADGRGDSCGTPGRC